MLVRTGSGRCPFLHLKPADGRLNPLYGGTRRDLVSIPAHMPHGASNRSRWLTTLSVLLVGLVVVIAIAAALVPALLPANDRIGGEGPTRSPPVIFVRSDLALPARPIPTPSLDPATTA